MGGTPGSEICLSGANQFVLAFITLHFTILPNSVCPLLAEAQTKTAEKHNIK